MTPTPPAAARRLADRLGVANYRIADHHRIPRDLVLAAVHRLGLEEEIDLNWTAHEMLTEVFEVAGRGDGLLALRGPDLDGTVDVLIDILDTAPAPPAPAPLKPTLWDGSSHPLAPSKQIAVNLISELTGSGPEQLGPGSKERRSVFENLYRGLGFGEPPPGASKPTLAREILERLGGVWDEECWSSGYTVTLEGLNRLLAHASMHVPAARAADAPEAGAEARILLAHIAQILTAEPRVWQGRPCIERMLAASYPHARQTEWPGWFFEFLTLGSLIEAFGGGPHPVPPVTFDYRRHHLWDLKTHALSAGPTLPLNDQRGIDAAVARHGGVGFIVLHGEPGYDHEAEFWQWHKQMRTGADLFGAPPQRRAGSRGLKTSFRPVALEALWLDAQALRRSPALVDFHQGGQADGSRRNPKYKLDLRLASGLRVGRVPL